MCVHKVGQVFVAAAIFCQHLYKRLIEKTSKKLSCVAWETGADLSKPDFPFSFLKRCKTNAILEMGLGT